MIWEHLFIKKGAHGLFPAAEVITVELTGTHCQTIGKRQVPPILPGYRKTVYIGCQFDIERGSIDLLMFDTGSNMQEENIPPQQIQAINGTEVEELRTQLVMSLLDQPSASKRLQAVNEVNKLTEVTERIISALLKTLNNDPNANVRLAALESLVQYVDLPEVREGLAMSITHQDSPLVQIALADLMVNLQEKGAIDAMKKLLKRPEIDKTVKQKIEESILQI